MRVICWHIQRIERFEVEDDDDDVNTAHAQPLCNAPKRTILKEITNMLENPNE